MTREQIVNLLMEQQDKMDKITEDKSNPDYMYYLGMSAMVDFLLMRIEYGE